MQLKCLRNALTWKDVVYTIPVPLGGCCVCNPLDVYSEGCAERWRQDKD